ncbi:malonic semialdehyde reductase [Actinosynnema pretiosum subsp. pretiosum]|uniref:Nitroreductase n=2 Tax=Actinosynnema TaxID=40566 RepID=C6WC85_ACTMD|nr:malonic semialdehyde reductase [Actinosynnema mirum]ACU39473.1 nitroreductase [Actinosynnema mirum DSM 43827]AXX32977.1 putative NADH dehydrogenase / NAD(P)H nitroreductase [Actinosynnema pretiosum subsp. pretiosum]QUF03162.1 malonic semialdehyde reductase [Actinosynnema pretiosum subsp. pretiosum]
MTATTTPLALSGEAQDLLFREARTASAFTSEPVTDERLRAVHDLVKWAPTSMNTQPLRVVYVRGDAARARLLPHMSEGNRAKVASAPVVALLAADVDFHEHMGKVFPHFAGARDMMEANPGRAEMAKLNAALQVGYFIVGVRAAGLAAGPMTGFDAEAVRAEFFAGTAQVPLVVVNIGHPDPEASFPRNPRLDFEEISTVL